MPTEISGFKVIKLKISKDSNVEHYMYAKEHSVREQCTEKPPGRTLFIIGTPPFVTESSLKCCFRKFGNVEAVYFQPSPSSTAPIFNDSQFFETPEVKGFKVAYVVFENQSSLNKAILSEEDLLLDDSYKLEVGLSKWKKEYNRQLVDTVELQKEIDSYMAEYDKKVELKEQAEKEAGLVDEDGWTKVTKKGRNPGFSRKESVHNKVIKRENLKRSKKQLLNFYRFQIRESKMNHLVKLREKFEEDKKKIEIMKKSRKFKPF